MQNNMLFDNIYIGHSPEDAEKLAAETWKVKNEIEKAEEKLNEPKIDEETPKDTSNLKFKDDPVKYVTEKGQAFIALAKKDPIEAAKQMPEIAGGAALAVLTLVSIILTLLTSGPTKEQTKAAADKAKKVAGNVKDKAAEAVSTGAEKAQSEVQKRSTRSSEKS
jgi:calnexin